eukprot:gb/GFBE01022404.1/.p1 GENE.gb/GFBE01022404.1/~~gb/GFBE01022404.1/.p1  ORF type:complete len:472 (+),score=116.99 gb/GFBE01022404.1/:1-1416(+)
MASPGPSSSTLNDLWNSTVGSDIAAVEPSELEAADVAGFVASVEKHLKDWGQLFTQVPNEHERRKEALGGALKIKSAAKKFEKVTSSLPGAAKAADGAEDTKTVSADSALSSSLEECQTIFHEVVLGLLELCFPIHETINSNDFKEAEARTAAMERMRVVTDLTDSLGKLFRKGKLSPKALASVGKDEPLAPEVLKMLEKSMNKQKQKDKKNKKKGGDSAADATAANLKAAKDAWDELEGRCSGLLGQEVWEGLCWHRGIFLFGYIRTLLDLQEGADGKNDRASASAADRGDAPAQQVPRALFLEAMRSFRGMLTAQGPVHSDIEDAALWQVASDGPHKDESARMFYHGIYTSMHLRSLKHLAELSYWLWKYGGKSVEDAKLAALLNRKFTHIVKHIMPHAGWTAEIEHERVLEIESTTLAALDFSSKLDQSLAKNFSKIALTSEGSKDKPGKAGGYSASPAPVAVPAAST